MAARHRSRHRAIQILYQCDLRGLDPQEALHNFYEGLYSEENEDRPVRDEFMEELVLGALNRREDIDKRIEEFSANWRIDRMSAVDRNILRLAIHEMIERKNPPAVIIDEALELARRFSGNESVAFINGVLDAVRKKIASPEQ
jgi:transcription antitermination protein NusB